MAPKKTRTILLEFDCQLDDGGLDEFIQNFASGRHVNLKDAVVFDEVMDGVLEELLEED